MKTSQRTVSPAELLEYVQTADAIQAWRKRKQEGTLPPVKCPYCEATFTQTRYWQEFCSTPCRITYHNRKRLYELEELRRIVKEIKRAHHPLKRVSRTRKPPAA